MKLTSLLLCLVLCACTGAEKAPDQQLCDAQAEAEARRRLHLHNDVECTCTNPPQVLAGKRPNFCQDDSYTPELGALGECARCGGMTPSCSNLICRTCAGTSGDCMACGARIIK